MKSRVFKRGSVGDRAGARTLSLLGTPPNSVTLQALADGSRNLAELQGRGGSPGSTLRARLRDLIDADVIVTRLARGVPRRSAEYQLTPAGEELLLITELLDRWLAESPNASPAFGGENAKAAIQALVGAWSATVLRALAIKPLSVADLDSLIRGISYPALERRIAAMRVTGQVEAVNGGGRETPYAVTAWLRRGIAPLLAAIRWECRHRAKNGAPVAASDVEAVFLLAVPLLKLDSELSGVCRLAVELPKGRERRLSGVMLDLQGGSVITCTSRLEGSADAWASGSMTAWLHALIEGDVASLELGGSGGLAHALVERMHRALFAPTARKGKVEVLR